MRANICFFGGHTPFFVQKWCMTLLIVPRFVHLLFSYSFFLSLLLHSMHTFPFAFVAFSWINGFSLSPSISAMSNSGRKFYVRIVYGSFSVCLAAITDNLCRKSTMLLIFHTDLVGSLLVSGVFFFLHGCITLTIFVLRNWNRHK